MENFDKSIYVNNIRSLANAQNKKISDLEKLAEVSTGYISRIDKDDSSAALSVEALIKIADDLGVSLEDLLKFDLSGMSVTESFLLQFIHKLTDDTKNDELTWTRILKHQMLRYDKKNVESGDYPLVEVYEKKSNDNSDSTKTTSFVGAKNFPTVFGTEEITGDWFYADMPDGNYLYLTNTAVESMLDDPEKDVYEVYLTSFDNTFEGYENARGTWVEEGLCTTFQSKPVLKNAIIKLRQEVDKSTQRLHLKDWAKDSIGNYLNPHKKSSSDDEVPF